MRRSYPYPETLLPAQGILTESSALKPLCLQSHLLYAIRSSMSPAVEEGDHGGKEVLEEPGPIQRRYAHGSPLPVESAFQGNPVQVGIR